MKIKIFEILKERNLSVYWLSKQTGISEQLLGKYKNKKIELISLVNTYKIAKAINVSIDDLIDED
ncbi:MAG: helix-turn-helix transcriptional regulator [Erysipelotrichaceae bacterium]|nr:helix-turn-helix transcriptional regulator [Erysipelotrichaceae bacterium]